jgi:P4 family phage/plasmid primase-like protien
MSDTTEVEFGDATIWVPFRETPSGGVKAVIDGSAVDVDEARKHRQPLDDARDTEAAEEELTDGVAIVAGDTTAVVTLPGAVAGEREDDVVLEQWAVDLLDGVRDPVILVGEDSDDVHLVASVPRSHEIQPGERVIDDGDGDETVQVRSGVVSVPVRRLPVVNDGVSQGLYLHDYPLGESDHPLVLTSAVKERTTADVELGKSADGSMTLDVVGSDIEEIDGPDAPIVSSWDEVCECFRLDSMDSRSLTEEEKSLPYYGEDPVEQCFLYLQSQREWIAGLDAAKKSVMSQSKAQLFRYDEESGRFVKDGEDSYVARLLQDKLGRHFSTSVANQVHHRLALTNAVDREWMDAGLYDDRRLLNCGNCVVDVETGEKEAHDPEWMFVSGVDADYRPDVDTSEVEEYLRSLVGNERDYKTLLEVLGTALLDESFKLFSVWHGPSDSGKSALAKFVRSVVGEDNSTSQPLENIQNEEDKVAKLFDSRVNIGTEIDGSKVSNTTALKKLSGGDDPMNAREKYGIGFEFYPSATPIFAANDPPKFVDRNNDIKNRLVPIKFPNTFVREPEGPNEKKKDPKITDRLTEPENKSAMLSLMLEGLQRYLEQGRRTTMRLQESREETWERYNSDADTVLRFVQECLVEEGSDDEVVHFKEIAYPAYQQFCNDINAEAKGQKTLREVIDGLVETTISASNPRTYTKTGGDRDWVLKRASLAESAMGYLPDDRLRKHDITEPGVDKDAVAESVPIADVSPDDGLMSVTGTVLNVTQYGDSQEMVLRDSSGEKIRVVDWSNGALSDVGYEEQWWVRDVEVGVDTDDDSGTDLKATFIPGKSSLKKVASGDIDDDGDGGVRRSKSVPIADLSPGQASVCVDVSVATVRTDDAPERMALCASVLDESTSSQTGEGGPEVVIWESEEVRMHASADDLIEPLTEYRLKNVKVDTYNGRTQIEITSASEVIEVEQGAGRTLGGGVGDDGDGGDDGEGDGAGVDVQTNTLDDALPDGGSDGDDGDGEVLRKEIEDALRDECPAEWDVVVEGAADRLGADAERVESVLDMMMKQGRVYQPETEVLAT